MNRQESRSSVDQECAPSVDLEKERIDSLLLQGETCLLKGDLTGLAYFDEVNRLSPDDPAVHFRQGISLFEYGSHEKEEKALHLALKKFKAATKLRSDFFEAWHAWGTTLIHLGNLSEQAHYFNQAKEKLEKALFYSGGQPSDVLADLYWSHAISWSKISAQSGEPHDSKIALESFEKSSSHQDKMPADFWNDYGSGCLFLGKKLNDPRLLWKAIECLKKAVNLSITSFSGWACLAKSLAELYYFTSDEELHSQASDCFSAALQILTCEDLLLDWAEFLKTSGKHTLNPKRLRLAIEKANLITKEGKEKKAQAIAADSLAFLGLFTERLDLIHQAEEEISAAIDRDEATADLWYGYGQVLNAFARYFNDEAYYREAIEKFQLALALDQSNHRIWFAIAENYRAIADNEVDSRAFHRAKRFYGKAIDLHPINTYLFAYAQTLSQYGENTHSQKWLEESLKQFRRLLSNQRNILAASPDWLFAYAATLDMVGDFYEEEEYYNQAIELFSFVMTVDPDFPNIHHRLALAYSHLGDLSGEIDHFYKAVHHYRLAEKRDNENENIILDWAITLINIARHTFDEYETQELYHQAEHKLNQAARLGNVQAYYHLACLYSLMGHYDQSIFFIKKADHYLSLPPVEEMLHDEWLDGVRATTDFRDFLADLERRAE